MRAMPSPTWRTLPTSLRSVSTSNFSIRCLRIDVISSGRSFFVAKAFEAAANARVDAQRAGLEDEASDQLRVDVAGGLDGSAGSLFDLADELVCLLVGEVHCRRQLDVENTLLGVGECLVLAHDLLDLRAPTLLGEELEEVPHERVGAAQDVLEDRGLRLRVDLGVLEQRSQLGDVVERGGEIDELLPDEVDLVVVARRVDQRTRVDAVGDCHQWATSCCFPRARRNRARRPPLRSAACGPHL